MQSIPLAAAFIYLATSAECTEPINRPTAVRGLNLGNNYIYNHISQGGLATIWPTHLLQAFGPPFIFYFPFRHIYVFAYCHGIVHWCLRVCVIIDRTDHTLVKITNVNSDVCRF